MIRVGENIYCAIADEIIINTWKRDVLTVRACGRAKGDDLPAVNAHLSDPHFQRKCHSSLGLPALRACLSLERWSHLAFLSYTMCANQLVSSTKTDSDEILEMKVDDGR